MSPWIKMISDEEATGELREMLDRVRTPHGTVDNVMRVHSLRPHTMAGHLALYRSVLHHEANQLPEWFLECVASYTSILNDCPYSLAHHWSNAADLIGETRRADAVLAALHRDPEDAFAGKELALLRYTGKLTRHPGTMTVDDVTACRNAGASDGDILEVNQVCAYFNYSNRLLNGLGVTTDGDAIGYYSSDVTTPAR
ncbi:carboxymuconolactone decarboxylase family protein [Leekyejoonella antrihumi]|uniref:Peroxidase-related enzyme n=1 Tax=Leekyejoonella antrihumi TaxID=1660198 RepID=A0A563DVY7_9MICO|nr:peroxidase-related enzyme [Leekyejoonella antrihumi]TWP34440.1 peroxidase-related enzyme [Leekyejoonella antrihumi]